MSLNAYILLSLADCIVAYQRQGFEMNSLRFPRIWCLLEFENGERMGSSPSIYSYIYVMEYDPVSHEEFAKHVVDSL